MAEAVRFGGVMRASRRRFGTFAAVMVGSIAVGLDAAGCASSGSESSAVRALRIDTKIGVFDAIAGGPPSGRPVLLLHGFPECGLEWESQVAALGAAGYFAVAPDQRGYSPGVRPSQVADYHLDHAALDVGLIADRLGWDRFDLVGHDWGAAVAWIASARYGSRVRTLTAVSVPHLGAFAEALRTDPAQQAASRYMDRFRRPAPIPENEILSAGPPALRGVSPARSAEYFRRMSEPGALTAALHWYRANNFEGYDQPVTAPTLFLATTNDPMVAAGAVRSTARWVTGPYRLEVLAGVGHNVPEEAAERTTALLLEHLAGHLG
ncbi:alpha/beta fold hydrolase [Pseudonocardia acaciae]|uniref:alpha/beta fold hydrolase n=1 Tax=Pseudonocardia acaciae TaxID=551276 RepID=UPI001FDEB0F1|nr:alpha/beta hydrolase [Pseudonocardia acaciae]